MFYIIISYYIHDIQLDVLLTKKDLEDIDSEEMYRVYDKWPEIAKEYYTKEMEKTNFSDIDHIIFAGMGGSGAIGDMIFSMLSKEDLHIRVVKGYHLPKTADSHTLVVAVSVSGDTVETLSVINYAIEKKCKIIAFSSGGKLKEICQKNQIQYRQIPTIHSPRASFTVFLYSILNVLESIIPINKNDINESIRELEKMRDIISFHNLTSTNTAINIAQWISGIPLIYYPWGLESAAIRFKNCLQENAKTHAMVEDVVEACHNGIVAWERESNVKPILLQGDDDYIKTKERWDILKAFFQSKDIDYREVTSVKGSILTKLVNLIYLLDYSTIYFSIIQGTNPSPVESINFIKEELK